MAWSALGDFAWIFEAFGTNPGERLARVLELAAQLDAARIPEARDIVSSFETVAVHFDPAHGGRVSKWLKTQSPNLATFAWQRGYGAFSVGPSDLDALRHYIDTQEEHHRTRTFQEGYRAFLTKYGIEYGERYVWD